MRDLGLLHNIHLYCLPPHTTHKLQPLDVGVFGPLENEWLDYCIEAVGEEGLLIDRHEFVRAYLTVRARSITEAVIKGAWKNTGISPYNPNIFTDADFAPSHSTSTQVHLPPSYPRAIATATAPDALPNIDDHPDSPETNLRTDPGSPMDVDIEDEEHMPGLELENPGDTTNTPNRVGA